MFDRVLLLLEKMGSDYPITVPTKDKNIALMILLANAYKVARQIEDSGVALDIKGRPTIIESIVRAFIESRQIKMFGDNDESEV